MTTQTITRKEIQLFQPLLEEMREIKGYLEELLLIIPEESLKEYRNPSQIKKDYLKALKSFPPSSKNDY